MTTPPSRSRLVAAGALALALSGSVVPSVTWAQAGPETPVLALFQTIAEKRFEDIGQHFCPEFAGQAAELDLGAALAGTLPEGVDPQVAEDALLFDVTGPDGSGEPIVTVVSEDATGTQLDVQATLNAALDPANSEPFIRAIVVAQLESSGMEVNDENIAAFMTLVQGQLEGMQMFSQSISTAITVTQGADGAWLICSPLEPAASPGASAAPIEPAASPGASAAPMTTTEPAASAAPA